jgi:Protein of unknown function (DUF3352)
VPGLQQSFRAALLAFGGAVSLLAAGCGGDDEPSSLAALVPPDAPFFVEATVRPEGDRAEAIVELSSRIGGIADPDQRIVELIDRGLAEEGGDLTFAEDIEPWLGEEGAIFVRSIEPSAFAGGMADAAYMVEVTDPEAAQGFIDKIPELGPEEELSEQSYEGTDYLAGPDGEVAVGLIADAYMVGGTEDSFKAAVDASGGESLADAEDFSDVVGDLDDSALAEMWLDLGTALDAAAESSGADDVEIDAARSALGPLLDEPIAMALSATSERITLDTSAAGEDGFGGGTELLEALPANAWLGLGLSDAGEELSQTLSGLGSLGSELGDPTLDPEAIAGALEARTGLDLEDDILSWIGNAAFYVAGTSEAGFEAGAVAEAVDSEQAAAAVAAGSEAFEQASGRPAQPPRLPGAEEGFSATSPTGKGLEIVLRDGVVVAALGGADPAANALEPEETLGDSESFGRAVDALGDDYAASMFVALPDFLVVAEQGDDGDTDYDAARPYTQALEYLILGTSSDGDRDLSRFVLGISE